MLVFLLLWEWAARVPISFNFPSPGATVAALGALLRSGALIEATLTSAQSLLLGFGAAALVGIPFGLVMGVVRPVGRVARIYVDLLIALPTAAPRAPRNSGKRHSCRPSKMRATPASTVARPLLFSSRGLRR